MPRYTPRVSRGFGAKVGISIADQILTGTPTDNRQQIWATWLYCVDWTTSRIFHQNNGNRLTIDGAPQFVFVNQAWSGTDAQQRFFMPGGATGVIWGGNLGVWHHVALYYDSNSLANLARLWWDGVELQWYDNIVPTGSYVAPTVGISIGNRNTAVDQAWKGRLHRFCVFAGIASADADAIVAALAVGACPIIEECGANATTWVEMDGATPIDLGTAKLSLTRSGTKAFTEPLPLPLWRQVQWRRRLFMRRERVENPAMCRLSFATPDNVHTANDALPAIGAVDSHGVSFWFMFHKSLSATAGRRMLDLATTYSGGGNNCWGVFFEQAAGSASVGYLKVYATFTDTTQHRPTFDFLPGVLYRVVINYDHSAYANVPRFWIDGIEYPAVQLSVATVGAVRTGGDTLIIGATLTGANATQDMSYAHVTANAAPYSDGSAIALSRGASPWSITDAAGPNGHPDFYAPLQNNVSEVIGGVTMTAVGSPQFYSPGLSGIMPIRMVRPGALDAPSEEQQIGLMGQVSM